MSKIILTLAVLAALAAANTAVAADRPEPSYRAGTFAVYRVNYSIRALAEIDCSAGCVSEWVYLERACGRAGQWTTVGLGFTGGVGQPYPYWSEWHQAYHRHCIYALAISGQGRVATAAPRRVR